jgi:hypothetical protein
MLTQPLLRGQVLTRMGTRWAALETQEKNRMDLLLTCVSS